MDHNRWREQIGIYDDHDGCECFFWYRLTRVVLDKIQRAVKQLCVCVCVCVCVCACACACACVCDGKKISNVDHLSVYEPPSIDAVDETHNNEHDDYVLHFTLQHFLFRYFVNLLL